MRTAVDHPAVVDVDHLVGENDRRTAVGHDHHGRVQLRKTRQDRPLDRRIDRRRGVVEHQEAWPAHEGPRERDPLALTAGQRRPSLADHGCVSVLEFGDEVVGLCELRRGHDVQLAHRVAEGDVVVDGVVEEEGLLEDDIDRVGQRRALEIEETVAVEADLSTVGIEESDEQMGERGLSRPGRTDERYRLAGAHAQAHGFDAATLVKGEPHRLRVCDPAEITVLRPRVQIPHTSGLGLSAAVGGGGSRAVGDVGLLPEDGLDPIPPDDGPGQLPEEPPEYPHRQRHQPEEVSEGDERSWVERSLVDAPGTDGENGEDADIGQRLDDRIEGGPQPAHLDHAIPEGIRSLTETADLGVLPAECLDHESGVERLVGDLGNLGSEPLGLGGNRPHTALEQVVGHQQGRHDGETDQGEERIGEDQQYCGDRDEDDDAERHRQGSGDERRRLDVLVDVRQQLPGGVAAMPLDGQLEIHVGHIDAIARLQAVLGEDCPATPQCDPDTPRRGDADHGQCGDRQGRRAHFTRLDTRKEHRVGDPTDDERRQHGHRREQRSPEPADGELSRCAAHLAGYQFRTAPEEGDILR